VTASGDTENAFFSGCESGRSRAKENLETFAKVESFDAVLIQFERFVVDAPTKYFFGLHYGIEMAREPGYSWIART